MKKTRYWTAILYIDSMIIPIEDIGGILQIPYCYILHDKDKDKDGNLLKPHYHLIICLPGPITYQNALERFNEVGKVSKCEAVKSMDYIYQYLIHNTEDARKKGKYQYQANERVTGNGFKIEAYTPITDEKRDEIERDIVKYILQKRVCNYVDALTYACKEHGEDGYKVVTTKSGLFERITRGNYLKYRERENKQAYRDMLEAFTATSGRQPRTRETTNERNDFTIKDIDATIGDDEEEQYNVCDF